MSFEPVFELGLWFLSDLDSAYEKLSNLSGKENEIYSNAFLSASGPTESRQRLRNSKRYQGIESVSAINVPDFISIIERLKYTVSMSNETVCCVVYEPFTFVVALDINLKIICYSFSKKHSKRLNIWSGPTVEQDWMKVMEGGVESNVPTKITGDIIRIVKGQRQAVLNVINSPINEFDDTSSSESKRDLSEPEVMKKNLHTVHSLEISNAPLHVLETKSHNNNNGIQSPQLLELKSEIRDMSLKVHHLEGEILVLRNIQKQKDAEFANVLKRVDYLESFIEKYIRVEKPVENTPSSRNNSIITDNNLNIMPSNGIRSFRCRLCLEDDCDINKEFLVSGCGHRFCVDCARNSILYNVEHGSFPMHCPTCVIDTGITNKTEILQHEAIKCLNKNEMDRYHTMSLKAWINKNPNIKLCIAPNCDGSVEVDPKANIDLIKCPTCQLEWCCKCVVKWHANSSCEKYQEWRQSNNSGERQFTSMVGHGFKQCPKCREGVQKDQGCNHMTCRCNCHFCYVCSHEIDGRNPYRHFNGGSCALFDNVLAD